VQARSIDLLGLQAEAARAGYAALAGGIEKARKALDEAVDTHVAANDGEAP